jgi:hypothetical protein
MRISSFTKPALLSSLFLSTLAGCVPPGAATDVEDPALAAAALVEGPASPGGAAIAASAVVAPAAAGDTTFTGTVYGIRATVAGKKGTTTKYYLKDSTGKTRPVDLTAAQAATLGLANGGLAQNVQFNGSLAGRIIRADTILGTGTVFDSAHTISGHKRFATLFCRFPELPSPASEDISFFSRLLGNQAPGLRNYFSAASNGTLDFDADELSFVSADFPDTLTDYLDPATGLVDNVGGLIQKCAEIANGSVYLPDYDGVLMLFSHHLGSGDGRFSFAADIQLVNDNVTKVYKLAALTPTAFRSQKLAAQTVADALRLLKTTDNSGDLDSNWDLLSGGGTCADPDPLFGCVAPLPAMPNRSIAGWIPSSRTYVPPVGTTEIVLDPADLAPASGHYSMARIPSATAGFFYSLEYRVLPASGHGYERNLPGSGVLIHRYNLNPSGVVSGVFVDHNGNGDPNDLGSAYAFNGSELSSPADKLDVKVLGTVAGGGMKVRIANQKTTLTITRPTGGTITGTGIWCGVAGTNCTKDVDVGSTLYLSVIAAENYVFDKFVGCSSINPAGSCVVAVQGPSTVTANFIYDGETDPPICRTKPTLPQCHGEP